MTTSALEMKRVDLHCVAATNNHCLDVYPGASGGKKNARQKVVVGDSSGTALVFHLGKHHEMQIDFQTAAPGTSGFPGGESTAGSNANNVAVSSLSLFQDQLFVMNGGRVNAYSRKGKHFFGFDSNVTEVIRRLQISTPHLYLAGEYVLTSFKEATELGFYMCPDRIHDILIVKRASESSSKREEAADAEPAPSDVLVACQDRTIRFIQDNKQITEGSCEAPVTSIIAGLGKSAKNTKGREVLYGTAAGSLGAFTLTPPGSRGPGSLIRKFTAMPSQRLAGITGLATCDINQDGVPDIFVAREDGNVEVHTFGALANAMDDNANRCGPEGEEMPVLAWRSTTSASEGVTGISTGAITTNRPDEIVVSTYSGKIMTFVHDSDRVSAEEVVSSMLPGKGRSADDAESEVKARLSSQKRSADDEAPASEVLESKIHQLQQELEAMKGDLKDKKKNYAELCGKDSKGPIDTTTMLAVASEFHVRTSWGLVENYDQKSAISSSQVGTSADEAKPSNSALTLVFEVDVPIDSIALQADIPLELYEGAEWANFDAMNCDDGDASNDDGGGSSNRKANEATNIVVSAGSPQLSIPTQDQGSSKMLYVVRPSDPSSTRLQVQFRPKEGHGGTIRAYITPKISPRSCQLKTFVVHALCLHQRLPPPSTTTSQSSPDYVNWEKLPLVGVKMTGTFTVSDAHHWIFNIIPNIPEALPGTPTSTKLLGTKEDAYSYYFRNAFSGTHLMVTYRKGEVIFMSENITTLSIAKEFMTAEATKRKIGIRLTNIPVGSASLQAGGYDASHHTLKRLLPLVAALRRLSSQSKLVDALKEIDAQESAAAELETTANNGKPAGSTYSSTQNGVIGAANNRGPMNPQELYLPPEHITILKNASRIQLASVYLPNSINYLMEVVTKLYADRAAFIGEPAPTAVVQSLEKALRDMLSHPEGAGGQYDDKSILAFFQSPKITSPTSPTGTSSPRGVGNAGY